MYKINNKNLLILLIPLLFSISSCKVQVANINNPSVFSASTSLSGVILELNNLIPVSDAEIKLDNKTTKSDKKGFYEIKNISTGDYSLTVAKSGYETLNLKINIDGKIKRNFLLKPVQNTNQPLVNPTPVAQIGAN